MPNSSEFWRDLDKAIQQIKDEAAYKALYPGGLPCGFTQWAEMRHEGLRAFEGLSHTNPIELLRSK